MPVSVRMPALGESVTEGTVTRWLKNEGDRIEADEPLLEVSTDKVDTEIPSPATGVVRRILVPVDGVVAVGAELAIIDSDGEEPAPAAAEPGPAAAPPRPTPTAEERGRPSPVPRPEPAAPAEAPRPQPVTAEAVQASREAAAAVEGGVEVRLPALGESVTEGTVTRWLKEVGDRVEADEPLLEISTDKVDTELPAPAAGTLAEIRVHEDGVAAVGDVLGVIRTTAAAAPAAPAAPPAPEAAPPPAAAPPPPAAAAAPPPPPAAPAPEAPAPAAEEQPAPGGVGYVTPLVRKLAAEHGVDLSTVVGTGVGGRIRKQDVLAAAEARREREAAAPAPAAPPEARVAPPAPSPLRGRTEKLSRLRTIIANRMVESLQISAQLTTVVEVDVTKIAKLREQVKDDFLATHGVKLSFLPFFALATVEALRVHPVLNASLDLDAGTVTYHDAEHLAIAVDTERGLVVPVIRNAGDLNLAGLARRIADVAERTRTNRVSPDELSGGTFTITNTGSRGALIDTPIINQPQVGILGTGVVVKRAAVVDDPELGEIIVPRSMCYLSLTYDHRLVDGADAARFLATIKERLEAGNFEAELGLA
ncbi:MAG TPA: 2-oxoglutarate dehydrogenase, E2 component, dihydrolipoamide succinyltransferase [Natronosporangium sp.]|nr:2-oxoglutarate dehydrogenase, E2 component, dihydrolipoamide succinyltransferase [Natronosporangium sp.]